MQGKFSSLEKQLFIQKTKIKKEKLYFFSKKAQFLSR